MDKLQKNSLTIIVSVVASVILVWGFGLGGKNIETVTKEVVKEVKETGQSLGALSGPDIPFDWLSWGGMRTYRESMNLTTATNTPCRVQAPAATSTLVSTTLRVGTGSSTATTWYASKATSAFATTTNIGQFALGSGAQGTMYVSTSTATVAGSVMTVDAGAVFAPNAWLVWSVAGTAISDTAGTKFNGACTAEFHVI